MSGVMQQEGKQKVSVAQLQQEILDMQGFRQEGDSSNRVRLGLGVIEKAFPNHTFPVAAVHEFLSYAHEDAAATNGFMAALLGRLMLREGYCLWVGVRRKIYPSALKHFGIAPDRVLFIDAPGSREALWTIEEGLKCEALAAVIGEIPDLSFTESRRLQLAVESSRITGLIHRYDPVRENTVACVSRWYIKSAPGQTPDGLPGVGHPRWQVKLARVRNGRPGSWLVEWTGNAFRQVAAPAPAAIPFIQPGIYG